MKRKVFVKICCLFFVFAACSLPLPEEWAPVVPQRTPPPAPAGLRAVTQNASQIDLSWEAVPGARIYSVYRSDRPDGEFALAASIVAAAYTDASVSADGEYYYRVTACADNQGESAPSAVASAFTRTPDAPENVSASPLSTASIRVSWKAAPGADSYRLYRASSSAGAYNLVSGDITGLSYTDDNVTANTDYYYKVSSVNNLGESEKSEYALGSTKVPAAPAGLTVGVETTTSLKIAWNAVPGASEYRVYMATSSVGQYSLLGSSTGAYFVHSGVNAGDIYYYKVSAVNIIGEGPQSAYTQGQISLPPAPSNVRLTPLSSSSIKVEWDAVPGATLYTVYKYTVYTSSTTVIGTTSAISYTHTGLKSGQNCSYQVTATNAAGTGPKSARVSAYTQPVALAEGLWYTDKYGSSEHYDNPYYVDYNYYSFPATGGTCYIQWGNEAHSGEVDSHQTVSAYWKNENSMTSLSTSYFINATNGFASPRSFTMPSTGYIVLCVYRYYDGSSGDYSIRWYK